MSVRNEPDRLILRQGEILKDEYRVINQIGEGTFSNVFLCINILNHHHFVIKTCRNKPNYNEAAKSEIKTMKILSKIDPHHHHFVRYYDYIFYKDHFCLIFEKLGLSLYSALQNREFAPFSIEVIRDLSWQILYSVHLLHYNKLIHTDLKLENILLCGNLIDKYGFDIETKKKATDCRLIDFGSVAIGGSWHHHLVTTRRYRAPEILMGLKWSYECDIWSLGCILVELATGSLFFDSRDTVEHLFLIQKLIEPFPQWMWNDCTDIEISRNVQHGLLPISAIPREKLHDFLTRPTLSESLSHFPKFKNLVLSMLHPNPEQRPSTSKLLDDPFFKS